MGTHFAAIADVATQLGITESWVRNLLRMKKRRIFVIGRKSFTDPPSVEILRRHLATHGNAAQRGRPKRR